MNIICVSDEREIKKFAKLARSAKLFVRGNAWGGGEFVYLYKNPHLIKVLAVAYQEDSLIGIAIFYQNHLYKLGAYVKPKYRRQGIGTLLAKEVTKRINETKKCKVCISQTRSINRHQFWKKVGYVVFSELWV